MKIIQVVSAIIRRDDQILMIKQPDIEGLYWFIPGGMIDPGELITEALSREVKEETGLNIIDDGRLAFITQVDAIYETRQTVAFTFDISAYDGTLMPADPDQLIHDAEFVPIDEAIQRLARIKWTSMREPLIAYLSKNRSFENVWQYRQHSFSDFQLIVGQEQN